MHTIYLDHASGTPLRKEVYEYMLPYLRDTYGNPSSIHQPGRSAAETLLQARRSIAKSLGVHPGELFFTSSGTEANNLALFGIARREIETKKSPRRHILVSSIEHPSILETARRLREDGFTVEYLPVDIFGRVSIETIEHFLRDDTLLVSIMYANNEIGTIEPIRAIGNHVRERFRNKATRPYVHTDACQAAGYLELSPDALAVDLLTLNSSKIGGPRGVGLLYVQNSTPISPHIVGGYQENGLRAGTENIPNTIGFAHALQIAQRERDNLTMKVTQLREYAITRIVEKIPEAILNGHPTERLPNNIHLSIPAIEGESLVLLLDTFGIAASTGSACTSHSLTPSHVLRALGQSGHLIHGSLRLTLGHTTTKRDVDTAVNALSMSVKKLRDLSPLTTRHITYS